MILMPDLFSFAYVPNWYGLFRRQGGLYFQERDRNHNGDVKISPEPDPERLIPGLSLW